MTCDLADFDDRARRDPWTRDSRPHIAIGMSPIHGRGGRLRWILPRNIRANGARRVIAPQRAENAIPRKIREAVTQHLPPQSGMSFHSICFPHRQHSFVRTNIGIACSHEFLVTGPPVAPIKVAMMKDLSFQNHFQKMVKV